jgi:tRNA(Ile)-lysidine synthetase-like protein
MERAFDRIELRRPPEPVSDLDLTIEDASEGSGTVRVGGETFAVAWGTTAQSGGTSEGFDLAALDFPLTVRGWLPGDRIRLTQGSRKLKKLFSDRKLARWRRYRVPVVADSAGRVLWVVSVSRAALAAPTPAGPTLFIRVGE